jgi:hypothetical protein
MSLDLNELRIVTASAYAGMMAPLTDLPSAVCSLTGDTDNDLPRPDEPDQDRAKLSLESLDGVRRRWRLGDISRLADVVPKVLAEAADDRRPAVVVPPRRTSWWEEAAGAWPDDIALLGPPASDVSRIADDKIFIREHLARLGAPVPRSAVVAAGDLSGGHARLARCLGTPFVLQAPQGAGGQGTYLVDSEAQLTAAVRSQPLVPRWLVSAYAGAVTINVPGVVHADGVEVMPASVQSSGVADLGAAYGAYCGSDFGAPAGLPSAVLSQAYAWTGAVGGWLYENEHRGVFGADIAVSGRDIAFLEVNPRIQGSSWLLSKLQRRCGSAPCLVEHVRAMLGQVPAGMAPAAANGWPAPPGSGAHLLFRWTGPSGIVRSVPTAGTYRVGARGVGARGLAVTVTGLPREGTLLTKGALAARLEADGSLTIADGSALRPEVGAFLSGLRSAFDLSRAAVAGGRCVG